MTTNIPPCPVGQHIEEFTYRTHIMHICFSDGPSQPQPFDWPMALAISVAVGLVATLLVYFVGILIVGYLHRKAKEQNSA